MNKRNYQKELDKLIEGNQKEGKIPRLFLHACCAPCSSYVMEYLSQYFEITIFFYNPNIAPEEEYAHRVAEIRRLIGEMEFVHPVTLVEGRYDPIEFYEMAKGLEDVPEGGERCFRSSRISWPGSGRIAPNSLRKVAREVLSSACHSSRKCASFSGSSSRMQPREVCAVICRRAFR